MVPDRLFLEVLNGAAPAGTSGMPPVFEVPADRPIVIGRLRPPSTPTARPSADIQLADILVSSRHVEIRRVAPGYWCVTDAGSSGGYFLNDQRLGGGTDRRLSPGDVLSLGGTRLKVHICAEPPAEGARTAAEWVEVLTREGWSQKADIALAAVPVEPIVDALAAALEAVPAAGATRENAASTLGALGPRAARAIPALLRALEGRPPALAPAAAYALGSIGPAAAAAVPALVRALERVEMGRPPEERDPFVTAAALRLRDAAAWALGAIGPAAAAAIPVLEDAILHDGFTVVAAAQHALERIRGKALP